MCQVNEAKPSSRIRRRPALKIVQLPAARDTKIAMFGKSYQISTERLKLFKSLLRNRKEANLTFAKFLRQLNIRGNCENFCIAKVKIVPVLAWGITVDEFQYTRRRGVSKTQGCPSAGLEERGGMQVPIMLSPDYCKRSTFVRQGGDRNHCWRVRVMI
jgi:hypothetical protein